MTLALEEFSFQYTSTGILLNDPNAVQGHFIDIDSVSGLDQAEYKLNVKSYDTGDGSISRLAGKEPRTVKVGGTIWGGSDSIEPLLDDLKANFALSNVIRPLYFKLPGVDARQVFCKSLGLKYDIDAVRRMNSTKFSVSFHADDPVIYGADERSVPLSKVGSAPGYTFNHGFDYSFGGPAPDQTAQIVNNGNAPVGFLFTVDGTAGQSVSQPVIYSRMTNTFVSINLGVGPFDVLVVDFYNQTVTLNGASRRGYVVQEGWFKLLPGVNELVLTDTSSTASRGTITYYDGYE